MLILQITWLSGSHSQIPTLSLKEQLYISLHYSSFFQTSAFIYLLLLLYVYLCIVVETILILPYLSFLSASGDCSTYLTAKPTSKIWPENVLSTVVGSLTMKGEMIKYLGMILHVSLIWMQIQNSSTLQKKNCNLWKCLYNTMYSFVWTTVQFLKLLN